MRKNFLKNMTVLFSAFGCMFLSAKANAQNATIFIPKKTWLSEISQGNYQKLFQFTENFAGLNVQSTSSGDLAQYKIASEQLKLETQIRIESSNETETGVALGLRPSVFNVETGVLNVEALIKKDLGFGLANIKLNVQCENIQIRWQPRNIIQAHIGFSSGQIQLDKFNFLIQKEEWHIDLVNCSDVPGFDQEFKNQFMEWLKTTTWLNDLKELVQEKAHAWILQQIEKSIFDIQSKFNLALQMQTVIDDSGHLWIFSTENQGAQNLNQEDLQSIIQKNKPLALFNKKFIEENLKKSVNEKLRQINISSESNSMLNKLTCSRLYQFFLWPSLRALPKCFKMQIQNKIQSLEISKVESLEFKINMGSWAINSNGADPHKYLAYFDTAFSTNLSRQQTFLEQFSARAYPDFINWSGKSSRISTGFVRSSVEELLKNTIRSSLVEESNASLITNSKWKIFNEKVIQIDLNFEQ